MGGCLINLIKESDMFGKEAKLFYKKEEQLSTKIGIFCSFAYYLAYIGFFSYKLYRMLNHMDVTAYDTFKYISLQPKIKLSKDNFYGGFALQDPNSYDSIIDESIYIPKAYYKEAIRNGTNKTWEWITRPLELEICKIEKFGDYFKNIFENNTLNNLYCFKKMNESLIGHFSYDYYSFLYIEIYACKNTTENQNKCKTREEMDYYLNSTFLSMEFEDVELSPDNYTYPVSPRNQDIYFKIGKNSFQDVHVFFQKLKIETDKDVVGLEVNELDDMKLDKTDLLKYHSMNPMLTILNDDIYETGRPLCAITFKLHEQIRIQRRTYPKLFSIWGDVGGLMEFIKVILSIFLNLITSIIYTIEVANSLFDNKLRRSKTLPKKIFKLGLNETQIKGYNYQLYDKKTDNENEEYKNNDIDSPNKNIDNSKNIKIDNSIINIGKNKNKNKKKYKRQKTISPGSKKKSKKKENCSLIYIIIYLFSSFFDIKRNTNIQFLKNANNIFAENMDIFNIFKNIKIYKKERIIPYI